MACHGRVQLLHLWLFRRKTHEMLRAMAAGLQFEAGETVCGLRLLGWRCCRRSETGGQALPKGWSFQCRISRIVWANSYEILHRDSKAVEKWWTMCLAAESAQRRTVEVRVIVGRKYMEIHQSAGMEQCSCLEENWYEKWLMLLTWIFISIFTKNISYERPWNQLQTLWIFVLVVWCPFDSGLFGSEGMLKEELQEIQVHLTLWLSYGPPKRWYLWDDVRLLPLVFGGAFVLWRSNLKQSFSHCEHRVSSGWAPGSIHYLWVQFHWYKHIVVGGPNLPNFWRWPNIINGASSHLL